MWLSIKLKLEKRPRILERYKEKEERVQKQKIQSIGVINQIIISNSQAIMRGGFYECQSLETPTRISEANWSHDKLECAGVQSVLCEVRC